MANMMMDDSNGALTESMAASNGTFNNGPSSQEVLQKSRETFADIGTVPWRERLANLGLQDEAALIGDDDTDAISEVFQDVLEMLMLENLYEQNPVGGSHQPAPPPPHVSQIQAAAIPSFRQNFSFMRCFITMHDIPSVVDPAIMHHCWGANYRALGPLPCPTWPDDDSFPWNDKDTARDSTVRVRRGRVVLISTTRGIPLQPTLCQIVHHVWQLPCEDRAKLYWSADMMTRTEERAPTCCRAPHGASAAVAAECTAGCDDVLVLAASVPMSGFTTHLLNFMFRVGATCEKLFMCVMSPGNGPPNPERALAECAPVVRSAIERAARAQRHEAIRSRTLSESDEGDKGLAVS